MREGVWRVETPRERRELAGLEDDLQTSPLRGEPLALRLRNFRPDGGGYLTALGGPLHYMLRVRDIDEQIVDHERRLTEAREGLRLAVPNDAAFAERWREVVEAWSFDEVNDLIERHNRWYPVESRLPMDPRRGDFALVNGRDYRRAPLDAGWALERFPALTPGAAP